MKNLASYSGVFILCAVLPTGNAFAPSARIPWSIQKTNTRRSNSLRENLLLQATGTPIHVIEPVGKGLLEDIKRKLPHYKSDFTDGFNIKSVSSTLFLFFACLAPAVAFGGLLGVATGGAMGTMETVGATALGGILYALFSAQPMTIIGTTGPLLAFLKVLHTACDAKGLPFLPVYSWVGLWSSFFLLLSSMFSASNVVEYFTRFTDEIFSSLISVIFIIEAVKDIVNSFTNPAVSGLQAGMSFIIATTTYATARILSGLRKTPFLNRKLRDIISDFAPTIGVGAGVLVSQFVTKKYNFALPMLSVPTVLSTTTGRPWLVDIFAVSNLVKLSCAVPALMATVLLFMDQNITVRLMMSKENKLKKGSGLHLDMFVVSLVTAITSVLGMPWMVAATVRSLAHMRSLRQYEISDTDGEIKVEMTGVQEQRITGLAIHTLIGLSVMTFRDALRGIPNAVLTGLFLFLGTSSIVTTELWNRFLLFFTYPKDTPKEAAHWMKEVGALRTKAFTAIQIALLGAMLWIKGTRLGVYFPVLIGALAPIRIALEKWNVFSQKELEALDGEIA